MTKRKYLTHEQFYRLVEFVKKMDVVDGKMAETTEVITEKALKVLQFNFNVKQVLRAIKTVGYKPNYGSPRGLAKTNLNNAMRLSALEKFLTDELGYQPPNIEG